MTLTKIYSFDDSRCVETNLSPCIEASAVTVSKYWQLFGEGYRVGLPARLLHVFIAPVVTLTDSNESVSIASMRRLFFGIPSGNAPPIDLSPVQFTEVFTKSRGEFRASVQGVCLSVQIPNDSKTIRLTGSFQITNNALSGNVTVSDFVYPLRFSNLATYLPSNELWNDHKYTVQTNIYKLKQEIRSNWSSLLRSETNIYQYAGEDVSSFRREERKIIDQGMSCVTMRHVSNKIKAVNDGLIRMIDSIMATNGYSLHTAKPSLNDRIYSGEHIFWNKRIYIQFIKSGLVVGLDSHVATHWENSEDGEYKYRVKYLDLFEPLPTSSNLNIEVVVAENSYISAQRKTFDENLWIFGALSSLLQERKLEVDEIAAAYVSNSSITKFAQEIKDADGIDEISIQTQAYECPPGQWRNAVKYIKVVSGANSVKKPAYIPSPPIDNVFSKCTRCFMEVPGIEMTRQHEPTSRYSQVFAKVLWYSLVNTMGKLRNDSKPLFNVCADITKEITIPLSNHSLAKTNTVSNYIACNSTGAEFYIADWSDMRLAKFKVMNLNTKEIIEYSELSEFYYRSCKSPPHMKISIGKNAPNPPFAMTLSSDDMTGYFTPNSPDLHSTSNRLLVTPETPLINQSIYRQLHDDFDKFMLSEHQINSGTLTPMSNVREQVFLCETKRSVTSDDEASVYVNLLILHYISKKAINLIERYSHRIYTIRADLVTLMSVKNAGNWVWDLMKMRPNFETLSVNAINIYNELLNLIKEGGRDILMRPDRVNDSVYISALVEMLNKYRAGYDKTLNKVVNYSRAEIVEALIEDLTRRYELYKYEIFYDTYIPLLRRNMNANTSIDAAVELKNIYSKKFTLTFAPSVDNDETILVMLRRHIADRNNLIFQNFHQKFLDTFIYVDELTDDVIERSLDRIIALSPDAYVSNFGYSEFNIHDYESNIEALCALNDLFTPWHNIQNLAMTVYDDICENDPILENKLEVFVATLLRNAEYTIEVTAEEMMRDLRDVIHIDHPEFELTEMYKNDILRMLQSSE